MTTTHEPLSDHDVQTTVLDELMWAADVDAAAIGVAVNAGVVTLSGHVDDIAGAAAVKDATFRVRGVTTVVDHLLVDQKGETCSEADMAKAVAAALSWATNVPDTVKAEVREHTVLLTGEVAWDFQRQAASYAVQYLRGIYAVNNMLTLTPRPSATDAEERIREALVRHAQLDANHISVSVRETKAVLTGHVRSWSEKQLVEAATWSSPHVTSVENQLEIRTTLP